MFLQQRTWSPFCRLVMASLYKIKTLPFEDQRAAATTATAAACRNLPLNVSHRETSTFWVSFWLFSNCQSCQIAHAITHGLICRTTDTDISYLSSSSSRLSEHAQYELHLSRVGLRADRTGQRVVGLCCWLQKRRHQRDAVKGSTTFDPQCLWPN